MKLNEMIRDGLFDASTRQLTKNDLANLFDVVNKGPKSYYNLCRGLRFENVDKMDPSHYNLYTVSEGDSWTGISFKHYQTVELWWLICKFNGVKNPFDELKPGSLIYVPTDELKDLILDTISRR